MAGPSDAAAMAMGDEAAEIGAAEAKGLLLSEAASVPFDRVALARHLERHGMRSDPSEPVRQFRGGFANRNYLLTIDGRPTVLRRPPDGDLPPGAHDMAREHRILSRLSPALPLAPRSLHHCADPSVLGAPFQLIEYRSGRVLRGDELVGFDDPERAGADLSEMLVRTLLAIHAVDVEAVGLGDLGRPQGFVARAVAGWSKRGLLLVADTPLAPTLEDVAAWLGRQRFGERRPTLLHCDFKLDNVILDERSPEPRAVVDWDMGTLGDPLFDLATTLSYWTEPGDPEPLLALRQMPTTRPGFWTRAQVAERYAALSGREIGDLHAMRVLALFKLAVVFIQLHGQWVRGAVRDERYATFGRLGGDMLLLTRDISHGPEAA